MLNQHGSPAAAPDPTAGMSFWDKLGAGAGKAFMDLGYGGGQLLGKISREDVDKMKKRDEPLMRTGAGFTGNILGNVAMAAPSYFIPGANTAIGSALIGGYMGAMQPVGTNDSRLLNTTIGAVGGPLGLTAGKLIGRAISPLTSRLSPEAETLAQAAEREGIPTTVGQRTGSKPLQTAESVMESLPSTARSAASTRDTQQRAYTAAVLRRAGMTGDSADPQALAAQKNTLGKLLGDIAQRNELDFNRGLSTRLDAIVDDAAAKLPPEEVSKLAGTVQRIKSGVPAGSPAKTVSSPILSQSGQPFTSTTPAVPSGPMPGTLYQGWRQPLKDMADNTATGRYYGQIRSAMDDAFRSQVPGAEGELYRGTSRQYANLKTVTDAMGGAGTLPANGQISPAQLSAALARSVGREGKALGQGDLNELSRIGQLFVKDQIPNSGTPQRLFMQNLLTGNLPGAAAGAGIGYYEGRSPESAALGAVGGFGASQGLPKLAQVLMQSPAVRAYLENQALSPAAREALVNALRIGATGAAPGAAAGATSLLAGQSQ